MAKRARKQVEKYGTATIIGGTAKNATNLERLVRDEPLATNLPTAFDSPVRITVVSYRTCLADTDGISAKAAIDGLVLSRIIKGDSLEEVTEVLYRQIKVDSEAEEKTILEIEAVGGDGCGVSRESERDK